MGKGKTSHFETSINSKANKKSLIQTVAISLFIFSWMSINIYLPALPFLSHDFHTDPNHLKLSITIFLLTFAISQLFWGPISEKYGRKKPVIWGVLLSMLGIILTMMANNVMVFNLGRFIEAFGLGCAPVLSRSILIDSLKPMAFSTTMAYATICTNIMPALAPIIGGHLLIWFGWRSIFLFLLLYAIMLFLLLMKLSETHVNLQNDIRITKTFQHYLEAFTHRKFIGYLAPYVLVTGAMIGYYTATPFLFITELHMSPNTYGFVSLFSVTTYIAGALISRFFTPQVGLKKMIIIGTTLLLAASIIFILITLFFYLSAWTVVLPMSIYTFAAGVICPNSNTGAMQALRHKAGAGAATLGFSLYGASALLSSIIVALPMHHLWPLTVYICIVSALAFWAFYALIVSPTQLFKELPHSQ